MLYNPFRHKEPPSFDATPASIKAEAATLITTTDAVCQSIKSQVTPENATFENTIRPLAADENRRSEKENHLRFYASTHPVKELREASYAAADLLNNAETDFYSNSEFFALVDSVARKTETRVLPAPDNESMHYLTKLHQRFVANGCNIADSQLRENFVSKTKRINEVAKQCRKNMAGEKTGLWLKRNELRGLPQNCMDRFVEGDGEQKGLLWVPTKNPFSLPILNYAAEGATRKKVYYAVMNRMPGNVPLHRELVLLRDEAARMLGWPNHFAFKTSQKMMGSSAVVQKLLSEVRAALKPVAEESSNDLLELKTEEAIARGDSTDDIRLYHWDRSYFETKADEKLDNTESSISEYFELNTTLQKLLDIYVLIFGVRFIPVEETSGELLDQKLVWHEDVRMFSAWHTDKTEPQFLGFAYLDLFPREGKYTHAGQYALQRRYQRADGTWFHPCSCLVMNYMKPSSERPTLLDFNDVRSLFHELGHMYHDFVETPSMMLEQFFWDPKIIHEVSYHYSHINQEMREAWLTTREEKTEDRRSQPPLKISLEHATKRATNETSHRVRKSLNELFYSTYDMLIHIPESHQDLQKTNLPELYNKTRNEIFGSHGGEALGEGWQYCQGQSVFRAIQGKYDAGYYAYLLGRLFAINIFEAGFAGDVLNKQSGRRYRDMVLCKGGTQPEMKTLSDYLGHEPSVEPYLAWLGMRQSGV